MKFLRQYQLKALNMLLDPKREVIIMPRMSGKSQFNKMIQKMKEGETKLSRENAALHKTSAFLADEARRTERAMVRGRWHR